MKPCLKIWHTELCTEKNVFKKQRNLSGEWWVAHQLILVAQCDFIWSLLATLFTLVKANKIQQYHPFMHSSTFPKFLFCFPNCIMIYLARFILLRLQYITIHSTPNTIPKKKTIIMAFHINTGLPDITSTIKCRHIDHVNGKMFTIYSNLVALSPKCWQD